jgi:hypothetical protein
MISKEYQLKIIKSKIKLLNIKPQTRELNKRRKKIYLKKFTRMKVRFFLNKFKRNKLKLKELFSIIIKSQLSKDTEQQNISEQFRILSTLQSQHLQN